MSVCEFCKNENQVTATCAYCGNFICGGSGNFVFGSQGEKMSAEVKITTKYIIIRKLSKTELATSVGAGAGFGLVGALVANGINAAMKKTYAYYDIQEIEKAIYPYQNKKYKKDLAVKIINKDGTDFILVFDMNGLFSSKSAKIMIDGIAKAGIFIENGLGKNYGAEYCSHPFVNMDTFGVRICKSASTFVKMTDKNYVAESANNSVNAPSFQMPVKNEVKVDAFTAQHENNSGNTDVKAQITCAMCGEKTESGSKFCPKCGASLIKESKTEPTTFNVEQWKNQW